MAWYVVRDMYGIVAVDRMQLLERLKNEHPAEVRQVSGEPEARAIVVVSHAAEEVKAASLQVRYVERALDDAIETTHADAEGVLVVPDYATRAEAESAAARMASAARVVASAARELGRARADLRERRRQWAMARAKLRAIRIGEV